MKKKEQTIDKGGQYLLTLRAKARGVAFRLTQI